MASLPERVARVEEQIKGLRRDVQHGTERADAAFSRGSVKIDELNRKVQANEISRWKQWIVVIILATGAGSIPPWLNKIIG